MFFAARTFVLTWMSTISSPFTRPPTLVTTAATPDIEANAVGRREASIPSSTPSSTRQTAASDSLAAFFGPSPRSSGGVPPTAIDNDATEPLPLDAPPPYAEAISPPSYAAVAEPPTLAKYLFQYGFLFPVFWLAGICILFNPLPPPGPDEDWEPGKTEEEKAALLELLRRTEAKWAKRCAAAIGTLIIGVCVGILVGLVVTKSR